MQENPEVNVDYIYPRITWSINSILAISSKGKCGIVIYPRTAVF